MSVSVQQSAFRGFANPVDPTPAELRAWAYHPNTVPLQTMPPDWDLLVSGDQLIPTLFELAMDGACPAPPVPRPCLNLYAADGIRTNFRAHRKRRLRRVVGQAEQEGDDAVAVWAHNTRRLLARPELYRQCRANRRAGQAPSMASSNRVGIS